MATSGLRLELGDIYDRTAVFSIITVSKITSHHLICAATKQGKFRRYVHPLVLKSLFELTESDELCREG